MADRLLAMWNEGGNTIRHVVATANRTETIGVADNKAFFYHYIRTKPGLVDDITVDGLMARAAAPSESRIEGYDSSHRITNFTVRDMYVAGAPMTSIPSVPLVMRNAYWSNIAVVAPGSSTLPLVNVSASDDYGIEGKDTGTFTFTRSGAIDAPLTVT